MDECIAFCHLLKQASCHAEKQLSTALKGSGLTMAQAMLLLHIDEGHNSISSLSEKLSCSCGNVTQLTDAVLEKDIVERQTCQDDRRVQHLKLTSKGKKLLDQVSNLLSAEAHECIASIGKKDLATLQRLLTEYVSEKEEVHA